MRGGPTGSPCPCCLLGWGERSQTTTERLYLAQPQEACEASLGSPWDLGRLRFRVPVTDCEGENAAEKGGLAGFVH